MPRTAPNFRIFEDHALAAECAWYFSNAGQRADSVTVHPRALTARYINLP
jgi:hypothetical protein